MMTTTFCPHASELSRSLTLCTHCLSLDCPECVSSTSSLQHFNHRQLPFAGPSVLPSVLATQRHVLSTWVMLDHLAFVMRKLSAATRYLASEHPLTLIDVKKNISEIYAETRTKAELVLNALAKATAMRDRGEVIATAENMGRISALVAKYEEEVFGRLVRMLGSDLAIGGKERVVTMKKLRYDLLGGGWAELAPSVVGEHAVLFEVCYPSRGTIRLPNCMYEDTFHYRISHSTILVHTIPHAYCLANVWTGERQPLPELVEGGRGTSLCLVTVLDKTFACYLDTTGTRLSVYQFAGLDPVKRTRRLITMGTLDIEGKLLLCSGLQDRYLLVMVSNNRTRLTGRVRSFLLDIADPDSGFIQSAEASLGPEIVLADGYANTSWNSEGGHAVGLAFTKDQAFEFNPHTSRVKALHLPEDNLFAKLAGGSAVVREGTARIPLRSGEVTEGYLYNFAAKTLTPTTRTDRCVILVRDFKKKRLIHRMEIDVRTTVEAVIKVLGKLVHGHWFNLTNEITSDRQMYAAINNAQPISDFGFRNGLNVAWLAEC